MIIYSFIKTRIFIKSPNITNLQKLHPTPTQLLYYLLLIYVANKTPNIAIRSYMLLHQQFANKPLIITPTFVEGSRFIIHIYSNTRLLPGAITRQTLLLSFTTYTIQLAINCHTGFLSFKT